MINIFGDFHQLAAVKFLPKCLNNSSPNHHFLGENISEIITLTVW
jgi:hypothetical protein